MSVTGQLMGGVVGRFPPSIIRAMAKQYAAGATLPEALQEVESLHQRGMAATVSVLGEAAGDERYAREQVDEFLAVASAAATANEPVDLRLGVKPTALGIDVSPALALSCLDRIAEGAAQHGRLLEVDMEQLRYVDATLDLVRQTRSRRGNVCAVVQAYLFRTPTDVAELVKDGIPTRIVKGTYKEGPADAYQLRESIRASYSALVRQYLAGGVPVGIATHDEFLIAQALNDIRELGVPSDAYEFQMIMGVQPTLRQALIDRGHRVRVTVHYGSDLHLWSVRRLKENPEISKYAARGIAEGVRRRIADRG